MRGLEKSSLLWYNVYAKSHLGAELAARARWHGYDLVDEACALIKTEMNSMPSEMDEVARKIMQHEIEEAALKKEKDKLSAEHLKDIQAELADMRAQFNEMKSKWDMEKQSIERLQKLREEIEQTNAEIERAQSNYDLGKAAELQYGKLPVLKKQLEEEELS